MNLRRRVIAELRRCPNSNARELAMIIYGRQDADLVGEVLEEVMALALAGVVEVSSPRKLEG